METLTTISRKEQLICQSIKQQIIDMAIDGSLDSDMAQLDIETIYVNALEINKEEFDLEDSIDKLMNYTSYDTREEAKEAVQLLKELYEDVDKHNDFCYSHDIFMWEQVENMTISDLYDLVF